MNQADLHKAIAADSGLTQAQVKSALDSLATVTHEVVNTGGDIYLNGMGRIRTVVTKARTGRNPRTGADIQIPAKNRVTFVVSKALKDAAN